MDLTRFSNSGFYNALEHFFDDLQVPISKIAEELTTPENIIPDNYKENNEAHKLIKSVYFLGMVNQNAFDNQENTQTLDIIKQSKKDYEGILIFGIELNSRQNNLLPTRSQLAEISRAFNREFYYTPVTIVFKYNNKIAFANSERLQYKQEWREGEKVGKVSLLRDIDINNPHSGHIRILEELKIPKTGKNAVDTFEKLYKYWQEVFNVNLLNKKFYKELSNWYFWAIKHVRFPNRPTEADAHKKSVSIDEMIREHNATNVIRLLTRVLFVWFIKEKKLIPEELFDINSLQDDILNDIAPYQDIDGLFSDANKDSIYYKAILQNLFFASLNCPAKADSIDTRQRGFRGDGYGTHRGIDHLMRYKKYFKNPDAFLHLMNNIVPFLNGGLFECLDDKYQDIYIDGFSDQMTKKEYLVVPDFLFFGKDICEDISEISGITDKQNKQADVKGLINILKSYKFTLTENTPVEEDVELDPELLGKVFENLLASYNPETKTTARKQTGSFYTPREIVNYMVDESLIAYLKNKIQLDNDNEKLDKDLHLLLDYSTINPFAGDKETTWKIITSLDECKILDPACGSGAFPMGILQKMVHILQKLDHDNELWRELQLQKAMDDTKTAYQIQDKKEREQRIIEINEAFDKNINDPDYARKLYLIENCIYGVDIQPIAIQISKLRFFISLVVDQKPNKDLDNFGIKPLPNLETRFVAANTLIGIDKPEAQGNLFNTDQIKKLETELKNVRHKLFNARTKETKLKYRKKDEELRNQIADLLKENNWSSETAEKLATWDPYDQNASSTFFDPEWMFDIKDGFDVVIGNPPYVDSETMSKNNLKFREALKLIYSSAKGNWDLFIVFIERGILLCKPNGALSFIVPNKLISAKYARDLRVYMNFFKLKEIIDYSHVDVFKEADVYPIVFLIEKSLDSQGKIFTKIMDSLLTVAKHNVIDLKLFTKDEYWDKFFFDTEVLELIIKISKGSTIASVCNMILGAATVNEAYEIKKVLKEKDNFKEGIFFKFINTGTIDPYENLWGKKSTQYIKGKYKFPIISSTDIAKINNKRLKQCHSPKLIIAGMAIRIECFYDYYGEFCAGKSTTIIVDNQEKLLSINGLLNSKLVSFWFAKSYNSLSMSGGYFNIGNNEISSIPLPIKLKKINCLNPLVKEIIDKKNIDNNCNTSTLENRIDELVFKLYDLTYDEVLVVCPDFWLSREEYAKIKI
jgi:adenine-specific DNA-methyltransferase